MKNLMEGCIAGRVALHLHEAPYSLRASGRLLRLARNRARQAHAILFKYDKTTEQ